MAIDSDLGWLRNGIFCKGAGQEIQRFVRPTNTPGGDIAHRNMCAAFRDEVARQLSARDRLAGDGCDLSGNNLHGIHHNTELTAVTKT
jgi:hypothetical protein